jgi:hypothetical protein
MHEVLSGKSGDVVYNIGAGERLTTGFPVSIHGENPPPYVVFIVTPLHKYILKSKIYYLHRE